MEDAGFAKALGVVHARDERHLYTTRESSDAAPAEEGEVGAELAAVGDVVDQAGAAVGVVLVGGDEVGRRGHGEALLDVREELVVRAVQPEESPDAEHGGEGTSLGVQPRDGLEEILVATFHVADAQNLDLVLHGARARRSAREDPTTRYLVVYEVAALSRVRVDRHFRFRLPLGFVRSNGGARVRAEDSRRATSPGEMPMTLEQWYRQMPVVTRSYLTLSFLTTAGCALELISPFSVYYNSHLIFKKGQLWRLFTNFFFFGSLGMDFVFHMFFLSRYRLLEEGTFRGRSADFFWMLLFGSALLSCAAPFINIQFLGASLTFMMVYVWGRRNQYVNMSFLGLFSFTAPYLPWVLLIFSVAIGSSPVVDLPRHGRGTRLLLPRGRLPDDDGPEVVRTPKVVKAMFGQADAPGEAWGAGQFRA